MSGRILRLAAALSTVSSFVACGAGTAVPPAQQQLPTQPKESHRSAPRTVDAPASAPTTPRRAADAPSNAVPSTPESNVVQNESIILQETFPSGLVVDRKLVGGPPPGPDLPKDTRILHVGDSFAGALGVELDKVLNASGIKTRLEFEKSTYIPTWAHSAKLSGLLARFKPDLVIISLGANELEIPEPEKRAPLIQKLVGSVGATPCVWVAPVLWEGAKSTLLEVIRANVGSCVYLDSNRMVKKMPRAGDKIHPSMAARPDWALATARWLAYHRKPTEGQPWTIAETP